MIIAKTQTNGKIRAKAKTCAESMGMTASGKIATGAQQIKRKKEENNNISDDDSSEYNSDKSCIMIHNDDADTESEESDDDAYTSEVRMPKLLITKHNVGT